MGYVKAVLRGKFIAVDAYIKKKKRKGDLNNPSFYFKKLEKEEQTKPK